MNLKIIHIKSENNNAFSLVLEKPKNFQFYPGQYLDIKLPVKDSNGTTRAFTISSSPTEKFLMITSKKGISEYKKFMENLKSGDVVKTSHPAGTFTLDESTPAVFICGGIGITPFRSMLRWVVDEKINTPIILIYSNSDNNFLFKKELNFWQKQLSNLIIHYIITTNSGRLDQESFFKLYPKPYPLNPIYYLAGSHEFVDGFEKILISAGIDETNIRYDRFDGY